MYSKYQKTNKQMKNIHDLILIEEEKVTSQKR